MKDTHPILIVDDNENEAFFLSRAFKKAGLHNPVCFLEDGEDAIAYLKGDGEYADRHRFPFPKIIMLDMKMPRLGGLDVLRWIRDHDDCRIIPTMIYSHSRLEEDVKQAYRLGANAYFYKPSATEDLEKLVSAIANFWQLVEVPPTPEKCI